ncbi:MAG: tail fiber protein [Victivallaceae bacterium]|nr:tail fiber protein [Victivallaceae bacterium]
MADSFTGEIRMFPYASLSRIPTDWALCNGDVLQIAQNPALAAVIGTIYGGNGRTTFQLPDFWRRAPMQPGCGPGLSQRYLAEQGGSETVSLNEGQLPAHTHEIKALHDKADRSDPTDCYLGFDDSENIKVYEPETTMEYVVMDGKLLAAAGESAGHENRQPFVALHFCISLNGIFPPRP